MWVNRNEWESLKRRVNDLEYATKVYGADSSYQVGQVVQMILTHLRLHIHFSHPKTELRSKDGPRKP